MKKSITIWIPVLLALGLCMSVQAPVMAAGTHRTVLRHSQETIVIKPDQTSVTKELKADDPGVIVKNKWYCTQRLGGSIMKDTADSLNATMKRARRLGFQAGEGAWDELNAEADNYLFRAKYDAVRFWADEEINKPEDETIDPPQGDILVMSWEDCYSKHDLQTAKRKIIRWAKYIKKEFPIK